MPMDRRCTRRAARTAAPPLQVVPRVGPYEVLRVLGSGTFAHTFEARHTLLGTAACLKVGRQRRHNDMLVNEARLLWDLHHPALPSLHDILSLPDGCLAIAMRYVEGISLEASTPIDVPTAARILRRLLHALRAIHQRGIVHNDVKPANIVVEADGGGVVLVDFGVSSSLSSRDGRARGLTPAFAAPEVAAGGAPLPESDLYSLALSMLTALGGDSRRGTLPSGVPAGLLSLLVAMTNREPSMRPRWGHGDPMQRLESMISHLL